MVRYLINLLAGVALLVAVLALVLPTAFSTKLAIVRSDSMSPAMPAGAVAVMREIDPAQIEVGDIIAFEPPWDPEVIVSHRVQEVRDNGFVAKGDANEDPDPFIVPAANVIGTVSWHIPRVGYALSELSTFARSIWGFMLLIVIPAAVIFGSAINDASFMLSPGRRRERLVRKRDQRLTRRAPKAWRLRRAG